MHSLDTIIALSLSKYSIFWAACTITIGCMSYCIWCIQREAQRFQHVPGPPKSSYLFGHVLDVKRAMEREDMMIQDLLYEWAKGYGPTFKIFIFHKVVIVTAHPMGIKEALLGGHPKADELYKRLVNLYGVRCGHETNMVTDLIELFVSDIVALPNAASTLLERFLGSGLVTLTDNKSWEHRRRAMDPAFKRQFLKGLMTQFNSTSDEFIQKLDNYADGQTVVSMSDEFHRITLDLIGKVAFSMNINCIHDNSSPFPAAIHDILAAMYAQLFKGDFGLNPWNASFYRKSRNAVLFLRKVGKDLIDSREAAMLRGERVPEDILSHAIKLSAAAEEELSIESMIDDFITFFIAGHETTANTLSFIILELGRHPDILCRLREELTSVIGSERELNYGHISRLAYMNMVVRESMRLYPTAPSTFRKLNRKCDIGGYIIPEETIVMVSNFVSSRNPTIFKDPLKFIPERFDVKVNSKIQTKVILTKFLLNFEFDLDMTQSFDMVEVATLKPKSKVNCCLWRLGEKGTKTNAL